MAEFSKRHAMKYQKPRRHLFGIGEIHGKVGREAFFMGLLSTKYDFGPVAEQDYPEEKATYMHTGIEGMPRKLVIRRRQPGRFGNIVEFLSSKTGIPMLKTGDEAFNSRFDVIGYKDEVLPWLTARRREIIASFLSHENCVVAKGGLECCFTKTYISLDDMEEAFAHLTAAQREL